MTRPRSSLVSVLDTPYYHCINRCVRRAWLCGEDALTGKSFEHRKPWMLARLKLLSLERGQGFARPLKEAGLIPVLAVQLIEVGEESGQLTDMLAKVAEIFDREVQSTLKRVLAIVEPALILGLGAMIAVIIISILSAILSLNELVGVG